ncbi:hypothetical protein PR001_g28499 [Phytophthora rubi]|uniref:Uncharacterized protein n=1 Tax=Phytophthora rubi TaxID=129364 RepID=A0A6A3H8R1_9STRA|nr:hypothetical protein PR001_g28499 [Phytophthora rubi]
MGVTAVKDPTKGKKKTNTSAKVKTSTFTSKTANKKAPTAILTTTTTTTTTKISVTRDPLSAPAKSGTKAKTSSKGKSVKSSDNPKRSAKTSSTKTGAKIGAALNPKTIKMKAEVNSKPKFSPDSGTNASASATKTSIPRMQDNVKKMIAEAVTREVKNGINFGQLTVTTTLTLHADQVQFLGSTMSWDYKDGPLKTVLKESLKGEYKKKRYQIVLLSMSYVRSGGGYLKMTVTYKRL